MSEINLTTVFFFIRVTSPYFVAGYDNESNRIAPIIKYMRGWTLSKIVSYCQNKGWMVEVLDQSDY